MKVAASGELDNGFTWNYHLDLDPGASGALVQDDAALTIGMGDMGTIGFFDGEGSLHSNLAWGIGALGTGSDYAGNMTISYGGDIEVRRTCNTTHQQTFFLSAFQLKLVTNQTEAT